MSFFLRVAWSAPAIASFMLLAACAGPKETSSTSLPDRAGTRCFGDEECKPGACKEGLTDHVSQCVTSCSTDSDCPDPQVCGYVGDGSRACVAQCTQKYGENILTNYPACWNGVMTPCDQLPQDSTCGCGCHEGSLCVPSQDKTRATCVPLKDTDGACATNAECKSHRCLVGHCAVPLGSPCTTYSCGDCRVLDKDAGTSFCTEACHGEVCDVGTCVDVDARTASPDPNSAGLCLAICTPDTGCANPALTCRQYIDKQFAFAPPYYACMP